MAEADDGVRDMRRRNISLVGWEWSLCHHRVALATHHTTFTDTLLPCVASSSSYSSSSSSSSSLSSSFTIIDTVVIFVTPSLSPSLVLRRGETKLEEREDVAGSPVEQGEATTALH
ncbi:hypothetical protein PIB30_003802 [Stylosanthes scabra]|uniref:Uncharacterized protein n=1 Tax=Stylosanthes scabra TaxID=79078 RepID=A0ABU6S2Z9_9FABA|nr:hypothetical protein [Stylosanthes scabra]